MASSPVAIAPNSKLDWRKMNKQELRDALASRGLDTNGLRPLLIQRLESSSKASVSAEALSTAAGAVETLLSKNETLTLTSQETLTLTLQNETLTLTSQKETLPRKWQEETLTLNKQKETLTLKLQEDVTDENAEFEDPRECKTVFRAVTGNEAPDAGLKVSSPRKVAPISGAEIGKRDLNGGNGSTTGSLSNLDKKRRRAERFGVGLQVSEEEKLALRAERFAGAQGKKKDSVQEPESEKRKQRAERFGIVDEATRKKARQERFPPTSKQDESVEVGKRKARAARFGAASDQSGSKENTSSKS